MGMGKYTCNDYRAEMILVGLRQRLNKPDIREDEKKELQAEIRKIEKEMGLE